jgi:hypothetical protein
MAQSLRQALSEKSVTVGHSESLELMSRAFGLDNWNVLAARIEADKPPAPALETAPAKPTLYCSFCGKSQHQVETLIAGPNTFICDACVGLCDGILLDKTLDRRIAAIRAARPDADAAAIAAEALAELSDAQILESHTKAPPALEHIEWSLAQVSAALAGEATTPWRADETAERRGWRDPIAGKPRDQILVQKATLEAQAVKLRDRIALVAQAMTDRGLNPA